MLLEELYGRTTSISVAKYSAVYVTASTAEQH
jgi:hypothetical protein